MGKRKLISARECPIYHRHVIAGDFLRQDAKGRLTFLTREAAASIAKYLLENGLLMHSTESSLNSDSIHVTFILRALKPDRELP